ncbi:MAG: hypothetical protein GX814_09715 [Microbacteriaceae bacterium]|nr:hypothetical protein [Microbacteriaceae bacterium]
MQEEVALATEAADVARAELAPYRKKYDLASAALTRAQSHSRHLYILLTVLVWLCFAACTAGWLVLVALLRGPAVLVMLGLVVAALVNAYAARACLSPAKHGWFTRILAIVVIAANSLFVFTGLWVSFFGFSPAEAEHPLARALIIGQIIWILALILLPIARRRKRSSVKKRTQQLSIVERRYQAERQSLQPVITGEEIALKALTRHRQRQANDYEQRTAEIAQRDTDLADREVRITAQEAALDTREIELDRLSHLLHRDGVDTFYSHLPDANHPAWGRDPEVWIESEKAAIVRLRQSLARQRGKLARALDDLSTERQQLAADHA